MSTTLLAEPPPAEAAAHEGEMDCGTVVAVEPPPQTADQMDWQENQRGGSGGLALWAFCTLVTAGMGTAVAWWWSHIIH